MYFCLCLFIHFLLYFLKSSHSAVQDGLRLSFTILLPQLSKFEDYQCATLILSPDLLCLLVFRKQNLPYSLAQISMSSGVCVLIEFALLPIPSPELHGRRSLCSDAFCSHLITCHLWDRVGSQLAIRSIICFPCNLESSWLCYPYFVNEEVGGSERWVDLPVSRGTRSWT